MKTIKITNNRPNHLALALALGLGLGAVTAQAQTIIEVGGAGTIGDTVLSTSKLPVAGANWTVTGNAGSGNKYSGLVSPGVLVTATGAVTLTFTHRYDFETGWDGGAVFVKVNSGPYTYLPAGSFSSNGYVGNTTSNAGSAWETGGEQVFYGQSAGYATPALIQSVADLGTLNAGDTVSVEFRGGWDSLQVNGPPAWEVGTVKLTDAAAADILDADFTANGASGFTVANVGTVTAPWTYLKPVSRFELNATTLAADRYQPNVVGSVIDLNGANIQVAKLTGTFVANSTFSLFDLSGGTTLTGTIGNLTLPAGTWDTSMLAVNGTITLLTPPPLLYEPFADADPSLTGNTPGAGFSGTWLGNGTVTAGSLLYGVLPVGPGNKTSFNNTNGYVSVGTSLSDAGLLADGATLWFSALVVTGSDIATNGDLGLALGTDQLNSGNNIPVANSGQALGFTFKNNLLRATHWFPGNLTRSTTNSGNSANAETLYLVAGKITWGASSETIEIYKVAPNLTLGAAVSTYTTTSNLDQSQFDTVSIGSKAANPFHYVDEIRFGATSADVLPIDNNPPTLVGTDFVDNKSGGPILESHTVVYTVTFSKVLNPATVDASDFDNGGTSPLTFNSVSVSANKVTVTATPTFPGAAGTLQLRVKAGAVIEDYLGNALNTASAIADDTTITVNADTIPPTVLSMVSPPAATPIYGLPTIPYTVTFDKYFMDDATVTAADFANAGTATISVGTVTRSSTGTTPAVYTFEVTPTSAGTLQLQVAGIVSDVMGNSVVTPVNDDTTYTLAAGPEPSRETVTLDSTLDISLRYVAGSTKTFTFDASASDKLVVVVTGEHNFGGNLSGDVTSVKYDGVLLTKAVEVAPQFSTLQTTTDLWYLDNPGSVHTAGSVEVVVVGNGTNYVQTAFALSGTAPGFGASARAIGSSATKLITSSSSSFVVSWLTLGGNGNTASTAETVLPNSPAGATTFGSKRQPNNYAGHAMARSAGLAVNTHTFSFNTGLTDVLTLAVEFLGAEIVSGNTFASWIAGYPGVGGQNGFGDDPDGDGNENGVENFLGTDPSVSSAGLLAGVKSGNTFTFTHPQNATPASDITGSYQWSVNLTTFLADGASNGTNTVTFAATPNTPVVGTTTVVATVTVGPVPAKLFANILVTTP